MRCRVRKTECMRCAVGKRVNDALSYRTYDCFFGLPRGRIAHSSPNRLAVSVTQLGSPKGRPRLTQQRNAATSASVCGWLTSCSQSVGDVGGHPQTPPVTGQAAPCSVRLTIIRLAGSTSDRATRSGSASGIAPKLSRARATQPDTSTSTVSAWTRRSTRLSIQRVDENGSGVDSLDLGNDSPTPPPPPQEQRTSSPTCPFRGAIHPPDQGSGRCAEDGLGRSVAESLWSGCRGCPAGSAGLAFLFTWSYLESLWRCP